MVSAGSFRGMGALASALEIDVWFEFVYSEANVADWPSRGRVDFAADLGAGPSVAVRLPSSDSWGSVESALARVGELGSPSKRARR